MLICSQEYTRAVVSVHPLAPFRPLASNGSSDASIVPTAPPPLSASILADLPQTHPAIEANTYIWIQPLTELSPEIWDFAEFVRDNAWKWVGVGATDNEYYTEVDHRREMDGNIVRREIVSADGQDGDERKVAVEVETQ